MEKVSGWRTREVGEAAMCNEQNAKYYAVTLRPTRHDSCIDRDASVCSQYVLTVLFAWPQHVFQSRQLYNFL